MKTKPPDLVSMVALNMVEWFGELDDSSDSLFGEFAIVDWDTHTGCITVLHETEPWGVKVHIEEFSR